MFNTAPDWAQPSVFAFDKAEIRGIGCRAMSQSQPRLLEQMRHLAGAGEEARAKVPAALIERRALDVATFAGGGALAAPEVRTTAIAPVRRPRPFLERVGATFLEGLTGRESVGLPEQTGKASMHWVDSVSDAPAQSNPPKFGNVVLTPKSMAGWFDADRNLLKQTGDDVESFLRRLLRGAVMEAFERAAMQGTGQGEPLGIENVDGKTAATDFANAGAPTFDEIIDAIGDVTKQHVAREDIVAVLAPEFATKLRKTKREAGSGRYLINGGVLAGAVRYEETAHAPANTIYLGDWADCVAGLWDEIELTVDPYARSMSGTIRFVAHHMGAVGFQRRAAFVRGK